MAADAEGKRFGKDQAWGSGHLQARALGLFEDAWVKAGRSDRELVPVVSGFEISADYNARLLQGAKAAAPDLAPVLAITTYFGAGLTAELFALPYGRGNPEPSVYFRARDIIRRDIYQEFEAWKATGRLCASLGIPMVAYEGGSHILATGFGDWNNPAHASFMTFLANLHRNPVMADLYLEHWVLWAAAGGRTASLFTDIGAYGYFGYWGAKEDVTEGMGQSPRYVAAKAFAKLQEGVRPVDDQAGKHPQFMTIASIRAEAGVPASIAVPASGGAGSLAAAILAGDAPPGMTASQLDGGGLRLQGTPETSGEYRFVARVVDRDGDPAYAIIEATIDPKGSSENRLLLFNPRDLPAAAPGKSENREEYRTRFDIVGTRSFATDSSAAGPRTYLPFDPATPLFAGHYADRTLSLPPSSPFALSGGLSLTLLADEFDRANADAAKESGSSQLDIKKTTTILWFGLRNRSLEGWLGSSLDLKADASHPQVRRFGIPSRFDALLLWRRDQMEAPAGQMVSFGRGEERSTLAVESEGIGADGAKWRFVLRQRGADGKPRYYLSEATWAETKAGRFSLSDFNNNPTQGKRWALFEPSAASFALPSDKSLSFLPVDFTDVDGVGLAIQSYRSGWHYNLGISRFLVLGKK
jgi:hypothetical protein